MTGSFFGNSADEDSLEDRNSVFWEALLDRIREDGFAIPPSTVLDVGCHRGGLLARIANRWGPTTLIGIEPIEAARSRAKLRLTAVTNTLAVLPPAEWSSIADDSVALVVSHEVLAFVPDTDELMRQIARVLAPGARAFLAVGCHSENPVWTRWRTQLQSSGRETYTHAPLEIMASGAKCGLVPSVRALRERGWATHNPLEDSFSFSSVAELLDHQFRHKLLFRFAKP